MGRLELVCRLAQGVVLRRHPSYLVYFVTSRCNCRCDMCFNRENVAAAADQRELALSDVEKVARSCHPLPQLLLSGGEPFLRRDVAEIVHLFHANAATLQVSIPTNGSLTELVLQSTETILERCPGLMLNINLSVDGIGEEHDRLRGRQGCFAGLLGTHDGLVALRRKHRNLTVNVLTTVQPENAGRVRDIVEYVQHRFDVNYHSVTLERGCRSSALDAEREKLEQLLKEREAGSGGIRTLPTFGRFAPALDRLVRNTLRRTRTGERRPFPCLAGKKMAVLSPDGMLYPCEPLWLERPSGTIRNAPDCRIADLSEFDFHVRRALQAPHARFIRNYVDRSQCTCQYGCAVLNSALYSPRMYPRYLKELFRTPH